MKMPADDVPGWNKLWTDAGTALEYIAQDDMLLAIGGFGLCGIPETLIVALRDDPFW